MSWIRCKAKWVQIAGLITLFFFIFSLGIPGTSFAAEAHQTDSDIAADASQFGWFAAVQYPEDRILTDGVSFHTLEKKLGEDNSVRVQYIKVDPSKPNIEVRPIVAGNGFGKLDTLTNLSQKNEAIAAINGPFYYVGGQQSPIDTTVLDQELLVQSDRLASALIFTTDKRVYIDQFLPQSTIRLLSKQMVFPLDSINRPTIDQGITVYDSRFPEEMTNNGEETTELVLEKNTQNNFKVTEIVEGSALIPPDGLVISFKGEQRSQAQNFKVGDQVEFEVDFEDHHNILHMLSNGPLLVQKGAKLEPIPSEDLESALWARNPRTAVGVTRKGEVLLVVVDGRQAESVGMTFQELADLMVDLGASEAMALDGGGSSEIVLAGEIMNTPSDGRERRISIGIGVINKLAVYLNGVRLQFAADDVQPTIVGGRMLVPLRKIFEDLGAELDWDPKTSKIVATQGKTRIVMQIGSTQAQVNGKSVKLDVPPQIMGNRTIVPLRFISQSFGGEVAWDQDTGNAYITTDN